MAAARINIPTIFVSGGPMLAGRLQDGRRTCLSHMFEAVGAYHAGKLDEDRRGGVRGERLPLLRQLLRHVHRQLHELPDRGHRHGACGATAPSPPSTPPACAWPSTPACRSWSCCEQNIRPRDIMTADAFHNAEIGRHGPGLLHQHHAAPARHRPRVRHRARPGHGQRDQRQDAQPLPPGPCGRHLYGGSGPGGRRVRRHEGADASAACSTPPS